MSAARLLVVVVISVVGILVGEHGSLRFVIDEERGIPVSRGKDRRWREIYTCIGILADQRTIRGSLLSPRMGLPR